MANAVSTAGSSEVLPWKLLPGLVPTTGHTTIPGCKAIPAMFNDPNTLQSTPLSATKNHTLH